MKHPSPLARCRGWLVSRTLNPPLGSNVDEDLFASEEGGGWVWYPLAGTFRPHPLGWRWRAAGPGAGIVGSLTLDGGRARFLPSAYWRGRGVYDWALEVTDQHRKGPWLGCHGDGGSVLLREL